VVETKRHYVSEIKPDLPHGKFKGTQTAQIVTDIERIAALTFAMSFAGERLFPADAEAQDTLPVV